MATPTAIQHAPSHAPGSRKLVVHTVLSSFTLVLGIALLIYMITVEDEPGALPLGLIVLGISWFVIARARLRPRVRGQGGPGRDAIAP